MMKLSLLVAMAVVGLGSLSYANATTLNYDHKYKDVEQSNKDELEITHQFKFGLKAALKLAFVPHEKSNGDAGSAFKDDRWDETEVGLSYPFDVTKHFSLEPGTKLDRARDEYKYKPFLTLGYSFDSGTSLSGRYRYEITDYTTDKDTKKTHRIDLGVSQKFGKFKVGYTFVYFDSNATLFDNKEQDYENKLKFSYKIMKSFTPYIVFEDVSVSKHTDKRQTEYKVGFTYKF
ncbi:oligogalacturonate-specific porin KdgM family protein [Celerinatantimonas sp. YJH-8]|uniref:oligogalacturonate-specific porin KdgM family protein n=1 Tax=Celerinatantimonas sp. YJH-8 TaxID=3228714 RepID=UPI0038C310CC